MSHKKPTTTQVVNDLISIIEKLEGEDVSYSWLSKEAAPIAFPTLTYLRFLSENNFVTVDRVNDVASITPQGSAALKNQDALRSAVISEFGDRIDASQDDEEFESLFELPESGASRADIYQRTSEVGTGGIGTVYLATQKPLNRRVAIKEIREIFNVFAGVKRDDIVVRFTEIIHKQAQLDHPNIIPLIDLITDTEFPFVVMGYAANGNLRRLINAEGRPPLETALKYFLQILHAFNKAHESNIHHGGVKPENIVLDSSGNALVTDFGISTIADLDTVKNNQVFVGVGTVAYMAPEQFSNPNVATATSDIYSLGILLYEMLTGKMPGRRSPMPSSFYPDIPRRLDDIFDKMSMDDPKDRYQAISEILHEIYTCEEIMKILDKRSGFQFLRDPITYSSLPLASLDNIAAPITTNYVETTSSIEAKQTSENHKSENPDVHVQEIDDKDKETTDEESYTAAATTSASDVLGRLDKYSDMFIEDDESEENEAEN